MTSCNLFIDVYSAEVHQRNLLTCTCASHQETDISKRPIEPGQEPGSLSVDFYNKRGQWARLGTTENHI